MKVTEISVEVGRTATINYQSARNSVGLTATLAAGDHAPTAIRSLQKQAVDMLLGDNEQFRDAENVTSVDAESLDAAIRTAAASRKN
jgi:hypothetical protein